MASRWPQILVAMLLVCSANRAFAQSLRLLEASSVTERDDHLDLSIDFTCTMRYQTHTPASEGDKLRVTLRLGPDCTLPLLGQFSAEHLLAADSRDLVRDIELQPGLADQAELIISWNRIEKYVVAPGAGMRGLRVRVMRTPSKSVMVNEKGAIGDSYSVNLESSRDAIEQVEIDQAAARFKVPVYVSEARLDDATWYRLRAGPFTTRREAESLLRLAQERYPTAWLAIDDEKDSVTPEGDELTTLPTVAAAKRPPETRADANLDKSLANARAALSRKRLDEAVTLLTSITASQDYEHRVDAQEMLGLARERKGQLAQAKAAYEEFLLRYPESSAAPRVRQRLQALRTASLAGLHGSGGGSGDAGGWKVNGGVSQIYRRDDTQLRSDNVSSNLVAQNTILTDFDGVARRRGERYDFTARASAGYGYDMLTNGPGDQVRVSAAYVDLSDRELGMSARLGRQSRGMAGVPGTFDGLLTYWQWRPQVGLGLVAGMPTESTRTGPDPDHQFLGLAADFATDDRHWDTAVYVLAQQYLGATDRRSVGVESHYVRPGRTLIAIVDYDLHFSAFNNIMLLGTVVTDSHWTFNMDASRQANPLLSSRNALIGQPTLAFGDLNQMFTDAQIEQLARDRSAQLTQLGLSASRPLGDSAQWSVNLVSVDLTGTPASGGVEAVVNQGRDDSIYSELLLNSLFKAGDVESLAVRYQRGGNGTLMSLGVGSRLPFGSSLRMTTRLRVDRRTFLTDDSTQLLLLPSLRLDYSLGRSMIEFESGAELGSRQRPGLSEQSNRFYFSLGYRLFLNTGRR
ncbi:MAG: SPOR domain-containing protein [Pseudomonadota bacterium]